MATHETPRPWRVQQDESGTFVLGINDITIAELDSENASASVNKADADLIVVAVNERERLLHAHDQLYLACRTTLDLLQNIVADDFARGADAAIRARLIEAIDQAELNGIRTRRQVEGEVA